MKNTGNAITDAYGHLEQAGIEEEKRTAMVKATLALQQPVLESIEDLASKMDDRIDKLASKMDDRINGLASKMDNRIDGLASKMDDRIDGLASKMDNRIDGLASKISELQVDMAKRDTRMARRDTGIIISVITLAIAVIGFILQMQSLQAL